MGFGVVGWPRRRKWENRLENERKWSAGWSGAAAVKGEENSQPGWGAAALEKKMGLGLGIFCIFSDVVKIAPPLKKNQCSLVFIGKVLLGFQTSPSTFPFLLFSSFFVNFDFSYFFVFLKASKYQHRLNAEN
jgi:hypothetical protein